jgi:hypothetical protein|tara:strand:- start:464 stop:628 length:165 start_codon:yes stop_codon:yes gene_type:complete
MNTIKENTPKTPTQEEMQNLHDEWWDSLSDSDKETIFREQESSEEEFFGEEVIK